jgi:hypothetical protein
LTKSWLTVSKKSAKFVLAAWLACRLHQHHLWLLAPLLQLSASHLLPLEASVAVNPLLALRLHLVAVVAAAVVARTSSAKQTFVESSTPGMICSDVLVICFFFV